MKMKLVSFASACLAAFPSAAAIRAVQLDLARQIETPAFVSAYLERAADAGMNTVVLYLEDRVKTASYPYPPDEESYSPDEIRSIVERAEALGLDLVPVVSPLGHTERFLRFPELKKFAEERAGFGRWGTNSKWNVFCHEIPEAVDFMERYVSEVASLFPGENLHLGFDETWDLGYCELCRPLMEKEGLGKLFMRRVLWAHGLAKRLGKRMWMWEDFFDFFPEELENLPKDIVLCAWNYDQQTERTGFRGHFGGRIRRDSLKDYERLGIECVFCPWFRASNIRTITSYAAPRKTAGAFLTQWEMETDFHGAFLPVVYAAGALWNGEAAEYGGDWLECGVAKTFPSLGPAARSAVAGILEDRHKLKFSQPSKSRALNEPLTDLSAPRTRSALALLRSSPLKPGLGATPSDPLSEAALLDDLATRTEMAMIADGVLPPLRTLQLPDRTAAESRAAKSALEAVLPRWLELCERRETQWRLWRGSPCSAAETELRKSVPELVEWSRSVPDVAPETEWLLESDVTMVDAFGIARFRVEGRFGGEWRELASGVWNLNPYTYAPAYFAKMVPVSLEAPPDALRIVQKGYGSGEICRVALRNRSRSLVPAKLLGASGEVRNPENLLVDDLRMVSFGNPDCTAAVLDPALADVESWAEYSLAEENTFSRPAAEGEGAASAVRRSFNPVFDAVVEPFGEAPSQFTVAVEFRTLETPEQIAIPGYVANAGTAPTNGLSLRIQSAANGMYDLQFSLAKPPKDGGAANGAAWVVGSGGEVAPGRWCRAVARWDGKKMLLDVDGKRIGETAREGAFVPPDDGLLSFNRAACGYTYYPLEMPVAVYERRSWSDAETAAFFASAGTDDPRAAETAAFLDRARKGDFRNPPGAGGEMPLPLHPMTLAKWLEATAFSRLQSGDAASACALARRRIAVAPDFSEPDGRADFIPSFAKALSAAGEDALAAGFLEDFRRSGLVEGDMSAAPLLGLDLADALAKTGRGYAAGCEREEAASAARGKRLEELLSPDTEVPRAPEPPAAEGPEFFVSPAGDDSGDGSRARPFATLTRARDAVRAALASGAKGAAVNLRGGRYEVRDTLVLGPEDSAPEGRCVRWRACEGEKPVVTGAASVGPLVPVTDPATLARIPEEARGKVLEADLSSIEGFRFEPMPAFGFGTKKRPAVVVSENGRAMELAKYPNEGFLRVANPDGAVRGLMTEQGFMQRGSAAKPGNGFFCGDAGLARFAGAKDLMVRGYWTYYWADLTSRVASVDPASGAVVMSLDGADAEPRIKTVKNAEPGNPFWFIGALEALDAPGEWYIDNDAKKLYAYPREGGGVQVSVARDALLAASGTRGVAFEGISFEGGCAGAVSFSACTNVFLRSCGFSCFGTVAVEIDGGRGVTMDGCSVSDTGHTALVVEGGDRRTLSPCGHIIDRCSFTRNSRYGRVHPAILVGGVGVAIARSEMHDMPSSVVRLEGNNHLFASNHVYDAVQECDDNAAIDIYRNPSYAGCRFIGNLFEDCGRAGGFADCGQCAIRFDGNISGMTVRGNTFRRCGTAYFGAVNVNGGRMNVIDSNVFEDCAKGVTVFFYPDWHWRWIWRGGNHHAVFIRGECFDNLKIREGVYAAEYPWMPRLPEMPQVNFVTRNVARGGVVFDRLPAATATYGNSSAPRGPERPEGD